MMPSLRITRKQRATIPVEVCGELHLRPGDVVDLERAEVDGEPVGVLPTRKSPPRPWLGGLADNLSECTFSRCHPGQCRGQASERGSVNGVGLESSVRVLSAGGPSPWKPQPGC